MGEMNNPERTANITITASRLQTPPPPQKEAPSQKSSFSVKETFVIHKVEKIWLDNPLFRKLRELVYRLDNEIFNRNGSAGPGYQPTRFSMILPFWFAIVSAIVYICNSFGGATDDTHTRHFLIAATIMLVINLLFCVKKVRSLSSLKRKTAYLFFIAVCSLLTFAVITFITVWLAAIIMFILVVYFMIIAMRGSMAASFEKRSQAAEPVATEEKWLDDGSVMGVTISRQGGVGNWHGSDGHTYTENMDGTFRQT